VILFDKSYLKYDISNAYSIIDLADPCWKKKRLGLYGTKIVRIENFNGIEKKKLSDQIWNVKSECNIYAHMIQTFSV